MVRPASAPMLRRPLFENGVLFASASAGLKEPGDFIKNAARAVLGHTPVWSLPVRIRAFGRQGPADPAFRSARSGSP